MHRLFYVFALMAVSAFNGLVEAKFPDDPKPCKYEDGACIIKIINYLMQEKVEGDSSLNYVKIDPLNVAKINIKQGEESPVNIDLTFIDNKIFGLQNSTAYKVKGFGKDLKGKHEIRMTMGYVSLVGDYTIGGKVLILPINGKGKSNITMLNSDLTMVFTGTPLEKNGETYMEVKNLRINVEPEKIYYNFGNLFNGDKALGDNMNLFLNENWKDIYNEVRKSFSDAFGLIFQSVVHTVFQKYPYEKYFLDN